MRRTWGLRSWHAKTVEPVVYLISQAIEKRLTPVSWKGEGLPSWKRLHAYTHYSAVLLIFQKFGTCISANISKRGRSSGLSCHFLRPYAVPILSLKSQLEWPSCFHDIRAKTFFESLNCDFLVPPPRTSCSPDTKSQVSASNIRSIHESATFSCHLLGPHILLIQNLEFQLEVSAVHMNLRLSRASSSDLMFFWYKISSFS